MKTEELLRHSSAYGRTVVRKQKIMKENNKEIEVGEFVDSIGVTRPDLIRFGQCYNIDLNSFCDYKPYFNRSNKLNEEGYSLLLGKKNQILEFRDDFFKGKSIQQLCLDLKFSLSEFIEFYNVNRETIQSHGYTLNPKFFPSKKLKLDSKVTNISTQLLRHLKSGFPSKISYKYEDVSINAPFTNIVGYNDFKISVIDQLSPIVDSKSLDLWGLRPPGGIILFGPPGCGKTFWAEQIAQYLQFQFVELPRSVFASSLVDGAVTKLKDILDNIEPKTVIFFDEFDSVAETRNNNSNGSRENVKLVNTLLQEIPKLIKREVVILAATNYLSRIDSAVIRPGRFDLKIPIFPPNNKERSEIIYNKLKKNLHSNSPLAKILKINKITSSNFFSKYSENMQLFSSSLLEDFVDTLKRSLKQSFDSGIEISKIQVNDSTINSVINMTKAKIVKQDLEFLANFYLEVNSFTGSKIYEDRLEELKIELASIFKGDSDPPRPIGFRMPYMKE